MRGYQILPVLPGLSPLGTRLSGRVGDILRVPRCLGVLRQPFPN